MKTKNKIIFLVMVFSLSIMIGLLDNSHLALGIPSDIDYTFENDNRYNDTITTYDDDFNIRNATIHYNNTDIFPATHSFTDDTIGEDPTDWIITEDNNAINVISDFDGHDKVVEFHDTSVTSQAMRKPTIHEEYGTVEWWYQTDDVSDDFLIMLYNDVEIALITYFRIGSDKFQYVDVTGWHDLALTPLDNIWYHLRLDFECGSGGYLGLNPDYFQITINGVDQGSFTFNNPQTEVDHIEFNSGGSDIDFYVYIDAVGLSWEGYEIGDNIYSYNTTISNTTKEVDVWEFAYEGFEDQYEVGEDVFSDWTEIDTHDTVNIATDPLNMADRRIHIDHASPETHDMGITREFNVASGLINVSWGVEFVSWSGLNEFTTMIYSSDDTLIFDIYIESGQLHSNSPLTFWNINLALNTYYEFNVLIDYESNEVIIMLYDEGVLSNTYIAEVINSAKDGLGKITSFIDISAGTDMELYLDYIGVYVNGSSLSTEFAYIQYDDILGVGEQYWYFQEHSLFSFDAEGNFSIYVSDTFYPPLIGDVSEITNGLAFYNGSYTINVFDLLVGLYSFVHEPMLWFQFYNSMEIPFNFSINGVLLTDGTNNYSLEFSSNNVEMNESYFYVENNYLYWTVTFNDTDTEYIQANFDIIDFSDDNYSMYVYGYEYGNGYGECGVNYADTSSVSYSLPSGLTPINNYLNQQIDIAEIVILITDSDDFSSGVNTGVIRGISFRYVSSADLTLATLTLTNVILNLIIIIIPSLIIYQGFGKKRDVLLISMILMLVVAFATSLLPMWIFFLGLMCMGAFFFIKTEAESF